MFNLFIKWASRLLLVAVAASSLAACSSADIPRSDCACNYQPINPARGAV